MQFGIESGIQQFLDLGSGTGMPTVGHVHAAAHALAPEAWVVYVDNEPVAVAHSQIEPEDVPNAAMVGADLEKPEQVLNHPTVRELIDFDQPVMVIMAALHFITDDRGPASLVAAYRDAIVPGSFVAISQDTGD